MVLAYLLLTLVTISFSSAAKISNFGLQWKPSIPRIPIPERLVTGPDGTVLPLLTTAYSFDQLIDHNNTGRGTFKQRYWADWEFYQVGGPIVLMTPGEEDAEGYVGYLTNQTISGQIAQENHGATILLEHRFFGSSNPYDSLTSPNLEFLTIEQAIEDLVYFAQNVDLPFNGGNLKPDTTPWILVGGSYAGALISWTMGSKPGIFHAGYASSAVVEPITNFYGYFTPIREHMPKNCSADVQAVVTYLDQIHAENHTDAIRDLKQSFGLEELSHVDDFASALTYNLFEWQALQPSSDSKSKFYPFCDALSVKDGVKANESGWGLEHAIHSWGSFWNDTYYTRLCGEADAESCLGTYDRNASYWTEAAVNNSLRSWHWMTCNQIGSFACGPPNGQPSIVSRILQPAYYERQCSYMFPEKFPVLTSPSSEKVNSMYKGWNISVDRLFFANGQNDPWLEETVSAEGVRRANTTMQPVYKSNGFHTSDMLLVNAFYDGTIHALQRAALEYIKNWLT